MRTVPDPARAHLVEGPLLTGTWRRLDLPGLAPGELVAVQHGPGPCDDEALLRWLRAGCGGPAPVRQGFVAVRRTADGEVRGVSGFRRELALLYALDGGRLVLGSHPSDVIGGLSRPPDLDPGKLADLLALHDDPDRTVFAGIRRVPRGQLLRHRPGQSTLTITSWFEPDDPLLSGPPDPREAPALLRSVATEAVAASLPATGDVAATLSGGLDSTFVVAIAAGLLQPDRTVHCATHVPLPGTADPSPGWEADDGPLASQMAQVVPGLTWRPLVNTGLVTPLEAVQAAFEQTWAPIRNAANRVWINQLHDWAASAAAPVLLTGESGNPAYSRNRGGLLAEMVRSGRVAGVAGQLRARRTTGTSWPRVLRGAAGELRRGRSRPRPDSTFARTILVRPGLISEEASATVRRLGEQRRLDSRDWDALLLRDASHLSRSRPGAGVWWSDPLGDEHVARLALRLPPEAWQAGGRDRGLAREAARGLVPDQVRLRTRRGAQASDVRQWTHGREQHYRDVLEDVAADDLLSELVDVGRLRALHAGVFASTGTDATALDQMTLDRTLGIGLFVRWWQERRRLLEAD